MFPPTAYRVVLSPRAPSGLFYLKQRHGNCTAKTTKTPKCTKNTPSIRQLRETLKRVREKKLLEENGPPKLKTGKEDSVGEYRMSPEKIKDSLQAVNAYFERFADCANQEEQLELRQILISSVKQFLKGLREKV